MRPHPPCLYIFLVRSECIHVAMYQLRPTNICQLGSCHTKLCWNHGRIDLEGSFCSLLLLFDHQFRDTSQRHNQCSQTARPRLLRCCTYLLGSLCSAMDRLTRRDICQRHSRYNQCTQCLFHICLAGKSYNHCCLLRLRTFQLHSRCNQ